MGSQKNVDMSQTKAKIKKVKVEEDAQEEKQQEKKQQPVSVQPKHTRSKKYKAVRAKVDRTRTYDAFSTIEMVKKLSYTNFEGTISAHLSLKSTGIRKEIEFPHSNGRERNIEIASKKTLEKIENGNIDFDVLLATPQFMSEITKYAPVLGPKGLMPNPKNGTLTPNPKQRKKELESGVIALKTERKAPLIHVPIGKTDMETKNIVENLRTLMTEFKKELKKVTVSATMSPGVKVDWESEVEEE